VPIVVTPAPTPTPTLFVPFNPGQARADAVNVGTAIQTAGDRGQITGPEVQLLQGQVAAVVQAIDNNDPAAAANAADTLLVQVNECAAQGRITPRGELQNAVLKLRQDLPAG
jgi:hypothetical protein